MKLHVEENASLAERYQARFTPSIFVLRPNGEPIQGSSGFLPPDEFAAFVSLGWAKTLYDARRWDEAAAAFEEIAGAWPETDPAPEALFWRAVANYKKTKSVEALKEGWRRIVERYPQSVWRKKVSFAAGEEARPGEPRERAPREPGEKGG